MTTVLFLISVTCATTLLLLSVVGLVVPKFEFWPPPHPNSWQRQAFLRVFRGMFYSLIGLTVIELINQPMTLSSVQLWIGVPIFTAGFGAALASTFDLGWGLAFGKGQSLKTTSWFGWSRNPIYVVTWIGMIGWGLFAMSGFVSIVLLLWAIVYLNLVFLEERWLLATYGEEYAEYMNVVPRFV